MKFKKIRLMTIPQNLKIKEKDQKWTKMWGNGAPKKKKNKVEKCLKRNSCLWFFSSLPINNTLMTNLSVLVKVKKQQQQITI